MKAEVTDNDLSHRLRFDGRFFRNRKEYRQGKNFLSYGKFQISVVFIDNHGNRFQPVPVIILIFLRRHRQTGFVKLYLPRVIIVHLNGDKTVDVLNDEVNVSLVLVRKLRHRVDRVIDDIAE